MLRNLQLLLAVLMLNLLLVPKAWAATLSADWVTNQDSATQYTIQATITAVNGNVRNITSQLDLAAAFGVGNYTFSVSQSSTTSQLLNLNPGYDGDGVTPGDELLVTNTILQNTTVTLTVVVTVTDPSLVNVSALNGFVFSTNPNTVIPISSIFVSIDTYPDIGISNQTSYAFSGSCSENGNLVSVVVSDGISNINTSATCISGSWSVSGLDVSSLNDGAITIDAAHSDSTNTATASVTVQKATTADVSISKSDGASTYTPGGISIYNLVVSNAGPMDLVGLGVNDVIPSGGTATWTCSGTGSASCTAAGAGDISELVNIPANESVTFVVTVTWSTDPTDY
ncbi:MAG: DUF11 domain-containing protein [Gammaproteobacteria bacterium]|nr:DUF11 domain-containing protein [Gammaproteobacteria bacterium]